nr:NADH dehydrogenase subunit 4L [Sobrala sp. SL-2021a]
MNNFLILIFFVGLMCLILIRKHILLCLISLEFLVLSLLIMIMIYCLFFTNSMYLYMLMMTFYVCEGVLGLSILVYMIRCYGNDYLNSFGLW